MSDLPVSYADHEPASALTARIEAGFGLRLAIAPHEVWRAWRGHRLHLDVWSPAATADLPPVILVHGGGGNGRILAPWADALCSSGLHVVAPDLPGYGITRVEPGWSPDYADWVDGVVDLARDVAKERGRPPVLYGLSMGGFVAIWAAIKLGRGAVAGVIATTLIDLRDPAILEASAKARWLGRLAGFGYRNLTALFDAVPLRVKDLAPLGAMSSDAQVNAILKRDPLIGRRWVSGRFFRTAHTYAAPSAVGAPLELPCPVLLVHPARTPGRRPRSAAPSSIASDHRNAWSSFRTGLTRLSRVRPSPNSRPPRSRSSGRRRPRPPEMRRAGACPAPALIRTDRSARVQKNPIKMAPRKRKTTPVVRTPTCCMA